MKKIWWRNRKWVTKCGQVIKVRNMSDRHVKNCIRFYRDKGFISQKTLSRYLMAEIKQMGEMAQDEFEQEFLGIIESPVTVWIDIFELELDYRKSHNIGVYGWNMKREKGLRTWIRKILIRSTN